jgi:phosphatidylserine/phosphatidylglycerophosphate/cardiolipin synthase-like enzyme
MILIDDEIFLSTGNFTYSSFAHNREFMFFIKDKILYEKLNNLFL